MRKSLAFPLMLSVFMLNSYAQDIADDRCDPEENDCRVDERVKEPLKTIYPYKPFTTEEIHTRVSRMTENKDFLWDIFEMERRGLNRATSKKQPWGSSFWPLFQGMIGNTYQKKDSSFFITTLLENLFWKENFSDWKNRRDDVYPNINDLEQKEINKMAPSEKYDLLLGDTSFDLTHRVWGYVETWGRGKQWNPDHLVYINYQDVEEQGYDPNNYRQPKGNSLMAFWEGICHGWALGAGLSPRPEKTVEFDLPNGKKLPFYASDVKALVSFMWANSDIQDYTLFEGNKCNKKSPDQDKWGRYIDVEKDPFLDPIDSIDPTPRCADVHPAVFHVSMMNIMGVEGRSFVLDHNPKAPIANQPVSGYEFEFYNPRTGKVGPLSKSLLSVEEYGKKDPYAVSRNPETTHIVGVDMNVKYIDWELPKKQETSKPEDDKIKDFKFRYDLEINRKGQIIGGQWRIKKTGGKLLFKSSTNQPDFFWVAPKNWKEFFKETPNLPEWRDELPPSDWKEAAKNDPNLHSFIRFENRECPVFSIDGEGPMLRVKCRHKFSRPRPLVQVVHKLLELSAGGIE